MCGFFENAYVINTTVGLVSGTLGVGYCIGVAQQGVPRFGHLSNQTVF
jgi:hypothetical protein